MEHFASHGTFVMQSLVSATAMGFSIYMLLSGQSAGIYLPVVTGIVGFWLPSPASRTERSSANANASHV